MREDFSPNSVRRTVQIKNHCQIDFYENLFFRVIGGGFFGVLWGDYGDGDAFDGVGFAIGAKVYIHSLQYRIVPCVFGPVGYARKVFLYA
jgi:hypothetical protein